MSAADRTSNKSEGTAMREPEAPMVALVLDRDFGEKLASLAKRGDVWVINTQANLEVARRLIGEGYDITTFRRRENFVPEESGAAMLDTIELHHGEYSRSPPYGRLEVYGAKLNEEFRRELENYGFREFTVKADHFEAKK
jgi:hypothetical protein